VGRLHLPRVLAHRGVAAEESGAAPEAPAEPEVEVEVDEETHRRVTPLELFFDLVFVFAMTQVTGFLYVAPSWTRLLEACAILMLLWLAWSGYLWLGNTAAGDGAQIRVVLLVAMAALLVVSLAVPHAFGTDALVFGIGYFCVQALHIAAYVVLSRDEPALRTAVLRLAGLTLPAASVLVLAGLVAGVGRAVCWVLAIAVIFGGGRLISTEGWRIEPAHFAERHASVIIIALGESIVALGVGAGGPHIRPAILGAMLLGLAVVGAMWWGYFDVVAGLAEERLRESDPHDRVPLARDAYMYLHLPMVTGVVIFAFGAKTTLTRYGPHLHAVAAAALAGGVGLYLLALSLFKWRTIGRLSYPRIAAAAVLAALAPVATQVPGLWALGLVAAVVVILAGYEFWRYGDARRVPVERLAPHSRGVSAG
jgi:low temperature requirement protein LtrA